MGTVLDLIVMVFTKKHFYRSTRYLLLDIQVVLDANPRSNQAYKHTGYKAIDSRCNKKYFKTDKKGKK